jgi:hypothetical protein
MKNRRGCRRKQGEKKMNNQFGRFCGVGVLFADGGALLDGTMTLGGSLFEGLFFSVLS